MTRSFILLALAVAVLWIVGPPAQASELQAALVQGPNIVTYTGKRLEKLSVQCPSDGGSGQKVYYRPGCALEADGGTLCVVDAGPGDVQIDFTSNSDPYQIDLSGTQDRIHLSNVSGYAAPIHCNIYRRNP